MYVNAVTSPLHRALSLALDPTRSPDWAAIRNHWLDALIQAEAFGVEDAVDPLGAAIRRKERAGFLRAAAAAIKQVSCRMSEKHLLDTH